MAPPLAILRDGPHRAAFALMKPTVGARVSVGGQPNGRAGLEASV